MPAALYRGKRLKQILEKLAPMANKPAGHAGIRRHRPAAISLKGPGHQALGRALRLAAPAFPYAKTRLAMLRPDLGQTYDSWIFSKTAC